MKTLAEVALEVVADASPKLEAGTAMFVMLLRRYSDGFLDVTLQGSPIRLTVDEVTRIFDTARDKLIAQAVATAMSSKGPG